MRASLAVISALLFSLVASAQGVEKSPFEWKLSGDTVENFSMQFVANHKTDQTSAKATVLAYAAFSDNRESTAKMMRGVGKKWDAAVRKSLGKYETELLTAAAIKNITNHESDTSVRDDKMQREMGAAKYVSQAADKSGGVWVRTSQAVVTKQRKEKTEKWKTSTQQIQRRFLCTKGADGVWRIAKVQQGDGKNWQDDHSMLLFILYAQKLVKAAKPVPSSDTRTAKSAAKSLFESLLARREHLDNTLHAKGLGEWAKALRPLFTAAYVKTQDDLAKSWVEQKEEPVVREVEKVLDGKDGLKVVKFKPRDQWTGAIEIHVKKTENGWRVAAANLQELSTNEKGKIGWTEINEPNLYKLAGR